MRKYTALATILLALLFAVNASAYDINPSDIDTSVLGTISLTLVDSTDRHNPVPGGIFTAYRVAGLDSGLKYIMTADFENCGADVNNLFAEGIAEHLELYVREHGIKGKTLECNEKCKLTFSGLTVGMYLIVQENSLPNYYPCSPFMVSVPMLDSEGTISYRIDATPKVSVRLENNSSVSTKLSVAKLWQGGAQHPDVTVTLMRDGMPYESVVLNAGNGWTYTWTELDSEYSWFAAEANVPAGFTVSYSHSGKTTNITNTSAKPGTPEETTAQEGTTSPPLINTGLYAWPIPVLAGTGIVLFAAGYIVFMRKGKKQ